MMDNARWLQPRLFFIMVALMALSVLFISGFQSNPLENDANLSAFNARSGLHDTVWPATLADLWRSSSVVGAGLSEGLSEDSLVTQTAVLPPDPMFGITYDDHTVYVLGGSPFLLSVFTDEYRGVSASSTLPEIVKQISFDSTIDPYIAKVDTDTMEVELLTLPRGPTANYIGSMIAHENGLIYALAMSTLFEIDPEKLEIIRTLDLPVPEADAEFAIYNSLTVWPTTGDLILKRTDFTQRTETVLMLVEKESLSVRAQTVADIGASRLTIVDDNGVTHVYASGTTQTLRFLVSEEGFTPDDAWSKTYRTADDGTQQAGGVVYMGNFEAISFVNNGTVTLGVKAPLRLYAQSTASTSNTLVSELVASSEPGGVFPINSADPHRSGMIAALDNVNGISTGWQLGQDGSLNKLWENDSNALSAGSAIAVDQGHLYTDDRSCDENGENCTLFFIVLDLGMGVEIARTEVAGTLPTIGHIFVGKNDVFYIATEAGKRIGFLTRISVR